MSSQNEMLVLAEMMSKDEFTWVKCDGYSVCKPFNPSTEELLEWLTSIGYINHIGSDSVAFAILLHPGKKQFTVSGDNLKQNILNVSLRVSKYLKGI